MLVAGLMSGTSADAIDVALVEIRGRGWNVKIRLRGFLSTPYKPAVRQRILAIAGGAAVSAREVSQLNFLLGELFGRACVAACRRFHIPVESLQLVGSHGQTIHHQAIARRECGIPVRSTLQIGEASRIAAITGSTVISDFRTADMAVGGQGAPLVPYFDYLVYRHRTRARIILNVGGIANLTVIPAGAGPENLIAFDAGPGNMLIDQLVSRFTHGRQLLDRDGRLASRGVVDEALVKRMLRQAYFSRRPPKSAGREEFGAEYLRRWFPLHSSAPPQSHRDAIATATAFTAASIALAVRRFALPLGPIPECFVSGGGTRNRFLMKELRRRFADLRFVPPMRVVSTESSAIPSEAKEAAAFALLAYQTHHEETGNLTAATGASRPVILGKTTCLEKK